MRIPPITVAQRVVTALEAGGFTAAVGGSGLLVALELSDVANDWDVTVDADAHEVGAALERAGLTYRDDTAGGGYATDVRFVVSEAGHEVDVLVGFALRGPDGVERLPTRVSGHWRGLPLADPRVWARAYRLLDRPAKAEILDRWLAENAAGR
ncbi:hypothetical protein [Amycolatopsis sp. 195334CR]|uniref:hypothetical protein n=1 Tax=Amycolatopsis sp. 195334CR TaxID=2814588 RepID=UPI001A90C040|nr:hypothetical protein [Amycolatopsis sp. 195334CR]MBN6038339.1 hypothetical protein [Amycolatopsis sp. 195334CR]